MSSDVGRLLSRLRTAPEIRARDIDALYEAAPAGKEDEVRPEIDALIAARFDAFTDKAGRRVVSRFKTTLPSAARLDHRGVEKLDVSEASGVAPLSGGRMLVIDDCRGVFFVKKNGKSKALLHAKDEDHDHYTPELSDLEGITVDAAEKNAFVVSEASRTIYRIPLSGSGNDLSAGAPIPLGSLPRLNDGTDNGWEGIAILPGRFTDGADRLIAIHEADPPQISIFDIPPDGNDSPLQPAQSFRVPRQAREHLLDISDVAVHPETGHVFCLSDRERTIVELELKQQTQPQRGGLIENLSIELVGITDIPDSKGTKPEGIGFDRDTTDLIVVAEKNKKSRVHRFAQT
ncbi:MAG: SdiA-regulated domain-containing protein [Deltaproteobacteria bacterium]|jgi:hypothetical protein